MNSFLKKILEATRLTRRGQLVEATAAIRRALGDRAGDKEDVIVVDAEANAVRQSRAPSTPVEVVERVEPTASVEATERVDVADPLEARPFVEALEPVRAPEATGAAEGGETIESIVTTGPADGSRGSGPIATASPVAEAPIALDDDALALDAAPVEALVRDATFTASSFTNASGTRGFKLFDPGAPADSPRPLVVMLHGCTQDPDDFAAGTRMNELARERGVFVLYPAQAARSNAHKCWNWFAPGDQRRGTGEPALIAGMVRHVMATHSIDAGRVFVAGLSAGAAMAAILAREYADLFAAVGIHSGLAAGAAHDVASAFAVMKSGPAGAALGRPVFTPFSTMAAQAASPATPAAGMGAAAVPTIVFHGDADATVAAANGDAVIAAALGDDASARLVRQVEPGTDPAKRRYRRTVWRVAGADADVPSVAEHWLVHGSPHAWSGGSSAGSFTDPAGPDASREMLRFFLVHPKPSVQR